MDITATLKEITALSIETRIRIVQAILDSIAAEQADLNLTETQQRELDRRIADYNPSRAEFNKLRSLELFRSIRQAGKHLYPKLPNSGLTIDTSQMSPQAAAHKICDFFGLKLLQG
ncbi:addiction module protein [Microseira sp. BLCC-F43]|jgi:putative addiction module component (TIGR02574 family)|uniref:addiction module protein n=1 Tax=Microseira sp. BLCC-F43 TaxID=3153602 RepID=UPI0035B986F5